MRGRKQEGTVGQQENLSDKQEEIGDKKYWEEKNRREQWGNRRIWVRNRCK